MRNEKFRLLISKPQNEIILYDSNHLYNLSLMLFDE